jgi:hypothetical protein
MMVAVPAGRMTRRLLWSQPVYIETLIGPKRPQSAKFRNDANEHHQLAAYLARSLIISVNGRGALLDEVVGSVVHKVMVSWIRHYGLAFPRQRFARPSSGQSIHASAYEELRNRAGNRTLF